MNKETQDELDNIFLESVVNIHAFITQKTDPTGSAIMLRLVEIAKRRAAAITQHPQAGSPEDSPKTCAEHIAGTSCAYWPSLNCSGGPCVGVRTRTASALRGPLGESPAQDKEKKNDTLQKM